MKARGERVCCDTSGEFEALNTLRLLGAASVLLELVRVEAVRGVSCHSVNGEDAEQLAR